MVDVEQLGLGRLEAPDDRDTRFPMSAVVPATTDRTWRYWFSNGWWGDQGSTPQCVGYSWVHWLEDGPVTHKVPAPVVNPSELYREAQKVDEWPGENYAGTSVRAGAKILKARGFISSYYWAFDLDTVVRTLLTTGPVVVGTWWYRDMFYPDYRGLVKIGGRRAGGHAYKLDGVNSDKELIRFKNSWGREWGKTGRAYISFTDMARLIDEAGEACLAMEVKSEAV